MKLVPFELHVTEAPGGHLVRFAVERQTYPLGSAVFDLTPVHAAWAFAIYRDLVRTPEDLVKVFPLQWNGWVPETVPQLPKVGLAVLGSIRLALKFAIKQIPDREPEPAETAP